jgi:integrase/recombinase XerD
LKLSTTIGKIQNSSNLKNIEIINEFLEYMRSNGSSEHHQNNNLKVVIAFGNFLGKDISFLDITKREQILDFLKVQPCSILPSCPLIFSSNFHSLVLI